MKNAYLLQTNNDDCGPVAYFNLLEWLDCNTHKASFLLDSCYHRAVDYRQGGSDIRGMLAGIGGIRGISICRLQEDEDSWWPTLERYLNSGCAILTAHTCLDGNGHFTLLIPGQPAYALNDHRTDAKGGGVQHMPVDPAKWSERIRRGRFSALAISKQPLIRLLAVR